MRNKKVIFTLITIGLIVGIGLIIAIVTSVSKSGYVAIVDNTKILKADYQKKLDSAKFFYIYSKQDLSTLPSLDKDTLEKMINDTLVQNYAVEHKITVTEAEIQSRYLQTVAGFNRNNKIIGREDEAFLSKIKQMYGIDKNTYLEQLKMDLLKEKVQAKVKTPLSKWLESQKKSASISRF